MHVKSHKRNLELLWIFLKKEKWLRIRVTPNNNTFLCLLLLSTQMNKIKNQDKKKSIFSLIKIQNLKL